MVNSLTRRVFQLAGEKGLHVPNPIRKHDGKYATTPRTSRLSYKVLVHMYLFDTNEVYLDTQVSTWTCFRDGSA